MSRFMAETKKEPDLAKQTALMERAVRWKLNKFTWSGLIILVVGILIVAVSPQLFVGNFSGEALFIGLGVIFIIVGIIRILIGVINPRAPIDLKPLEPTLDDDLFKQEEES